MWTGTGTNGRAVPAAYADCNQWSSDTGQGATGRRDRNDPNRTILPSVQWRSCTALARVYCFQN